MLSHFERFPLESLHTFGTEGLKTINQELLSE